MEKVRFIIVLAVLMCFGCSAAYAASVWTETVPIDQTATISPSYAPLEGETVAVPYDLTVTVYDDGFISNTYLDFARGLLHYVPLGKDYVFARTGQYQYVFAIGDFSSGFSDSQTEIFQLDLANNWNDNSYTYMNYVDDFYLSVGSGLVYSNIAPYPELRGGDYSYEIFFAIAFTIAMFGVWTVIRHVPFFGRG